MTIDWIDIAITVLTTGFFSLIGFVWRFSHKVTALEKDVEIYKRRTAKMEKDHDKVMDRMYSIAKSRSEFLTRDSYREDSREIQDAVFVLTLIAVGIGAIFGKEVLDSIIEWMDTIGDFNSASDNLLGGVVLPAPGTLAVFAALPFLTGSRRRK